ncbi:hypothetical protein SARC_10081 [Sphaeroforma arctica JP610]|uniref:Uncharacterized protein n=1 Tax=Sphaeroforma arctica JP610 TaxID=667725 RepID=A0A0L0FL15_9EUKA|nr:hypothetical protein SARC_10081 [Sphaeroforma arctica JP610]KNC77460.1 hypothetical protein SARC_10081 [Sphaeroforma arctica JP610]|eukprot:XP_014151362.1 hypothetical protein SARC_10081 [Sphaeroforma arctica JP610]
MTKHYKDPEQLNRIIIDKLRQSGRLFVREVFNDMQNVTLNVELEKRYRNSDKEPIHTQILKIIRYQALTYYGQYEKVDAIIKADKQPDGNEGHLSDMKHTVFHSRTEATVRAVAKVQPVSAQTRQWRTEPNQPNQ